MPSPASTWCAPASVVSSAALLVILGAAALGGCGTSTVTTDAAPPAAAAVPVGLAALTDLAGLAQQRPAGFRTQQVSSYDRTGGNLDFGISAEDALALTGFRAKLDNSFLYRDGDRYVIFDEVGPGIVTRIWMTEFTVSLGGSIAGDLAFELDDEPTPRVQMSRQELFSGHVAPFLAPLAGNETMSSGSYYSIVPIPYARRLRISTSTVPHYVNITYTRLPADHPIASFDPAEDVSATAAVLAAAGTDPKGVEPTRAAQVAINVAPGASQPLWERTGPGTVLRLEVTGPPGAAMPLGLRLQASWDAAAAPQVDAPLDDFFGAALGPGARSLAFGRDGNRFYCYFAMPFQRAARFVLRNDGAAAVTGWTFRLGAVDDVLGATPLPFHAQSTTAQRVPDGHDVVMLDTTGSGHVVGVVLTAGCGVQGRCGGGSAGMDGTHLEGDERVYIDGSRYPQLHGTGLEDFFNGGFYFIKGPFTLPTHGSPASAATSGRRPGFGLRAMYRLLLGDAIVFTNRIRLGVEHGPGNDVPAEMHGLVFYYASPDATVLETDSILLGDPASEAAHALSADGRTDVTRSSVFRGDDDAVRLRATGFTAMVTRFRVAIDPANRGVRLRRLADIGAGTQSAVVRVNGTAVGTWHSAEVNPNQRWADLDFEIPAGSTAGHDHLDVELDATGSPTPWTAYGYTVFTYR